MTTVTQDGRLAASLLDARRGMGLTAAGLADDARVPLRVVEDAERGGGLPPEAVPAVLGALGLDPAPYLDLPPGQATVRAVDQDHARTMAYLARVTEGEDGWLLHPDVAAVPHVGDCTDAELEEARRTASRPWTVPATSTQRVGSIAMWVTPFVGTVAGVCVIVGAMCGCADQGTRMGTAEDVALVEWSSGIVALCAATFWGTSRLYPDDAEERRAAHRALAIRRESATASARKVALGARTGFLVSRDGVTTLVTGVDGLARRDYQVEAFRSVDVRDEDDGHVTVEVDSVVGRVTMPWLPRSATLTRLVSDWRSRIDAVPEGGPQ